MIRYILFLMMMAASRLIALEPHEVVIVYNGDSPLSRTVAEYYRELRGIPGAQCLPVYGIGSEPDINRETFNQKIRLALLMRGRELGLMWPSGPRNGKRLIRAMALMPDLPLRVAGVPGQKGNGMASLDSELMLLGAEYPLAGPGRNPLMGKPAPRGNEEQKVMIVCRLDGPDEASIYRMVNDPIRVEKTGLLGWAVIDEGGPHAEGEKMFRAAAQTARKNNVPLFYETSKKTLADSFPLMKQTAVYFGWYAGKANGPFGPNAPKEFRFAPGALAFHLHSFSAVSIKDKSNWVGALLDRGASVTAGNAAEPYLGGCINYGILYERLMAGDTVGEATLSATPCVSWMNIVLGDPLYRPFPRRASISSEWDPFVHWKAICKKAQGNLKRLQNGIEAVIPTGNGALYAEIFAWHCAEEKNYHLAAQYFTLAAERYITQADKTRASLLAMTVMSLAGDEKSAEYNARKWQNESAGSPYRPAIIETVNTILAQKKK